MYAHVGGLGDLRDRIARSGSLELTDALSAAATGRAGREALHAVAMAYRAYAHSAPASTPRCSARPTAATTSARPRAARLVGVLAAVLRGYGLEGDDAIHAVRLLRSALHGFVSLESAAGSRCRSGWRRPTSG